MHAFPARDPLPSPGAGKVISLRPSAAPDTGSALTSGLPAPMGALLETGVCAPPRSPALVPEGPATGSDGPLAAGPGGGAAPSPLLAASSVPGAPLSLGAACGDAAGPAGATGAAAVASLLPPLDATVVVLAPWDRAAASLRAVLLLGTAVGPSSCINSSVGPFASRP